MLGCMVIGSDFLSTNQQCTAPNGYRPYNWNFSRFGSMSALDRTWLRASSRL
jgi:hypothetical protein